MKAFVFAAGLGTRLHPLTLTRPKALVEVCGKPMLAHVVDRMLDCGMEQVIVNVHHFAPLIEDYIERRYGKSERVVVSDETHRLLDTGGALVYADELIGDAGELMIHNVDILSDFPIAEMMEKHIAGQADATLLVSARESSRSLMFEQGRMHAWHNRLTGEVRPAGADITRSVCRAFGGVHIIHCRSVLPALQSYAATHGEVFSITPFYADTCGCLNIQAFEPDRQYLWHDIGTPEKLKAAEEDYLSRHGIK